MNRIEEVLHEYLRTVENCLKLFDEKFGRRDLLQAWREGAVPREGMLTHNVEYELHGVGCWVRFPDFEIDFDFGPRGRSDGFDLWRLSKYARQFKNRFPEYQQKSRLEEAFEELKRNGVITQSFPAECLLYFMTDH